jgi:hypothetical protein
LSDVGSPYEVRCPRCNVTFPVETRTCIHCGGPTSASGTHSVHEEEMRPIGIDMSGSAMPRPGERVGDVHEEVEAPSVLRSIVNSLGALLWIALLVIFSLARQCGD